MSDRLRFSRLRANANARFLCELLMIFLLLRSCHASVQPFLTAADFERATADEEVTHLTEEDFRNAEKYSDLLTEKKSRKSSVFGHQKSLHGDIRGRARLNLKASRLGQKNGVRRNGVISTIKKWHQGRIPYVLSTQYNERERAVLARAFQEYQRQTCIRFTPKEAFDRDYLYVGKIDDTIIHELLHAVGFYHEHERWDRDRFISILWQNIDREAYDQFGRVDLSESSYLGEPYDYRSILHYDSLAFSKNGKETVIARAPGMTSVIGSALDFSPSDLVKIKRMYTCGMPTEPIVPTADHFAQYQNYGLTPVSSPWSPLSSTLPLGNHVLEQPALPLPAFPRAQPEAPSTTEATTAGVCADRSTLCWRWLDRCHSPFFEKIMREFCAQSCGFCTPQPSRTWRAYSEGHQSAQGYSLPVYQVPYAFG